MPKARCGSWRCRCSSAALGLIPGRPRRPDPESTTTVAIGTNRVHGSGFAAVRRPGTTRETLLFHELLAAIALDIKQRGEIAVIDAGVRARRDLRLGPIGDAEPGGVQHRKIIRAVTDRERVLAREPELFGEFQEGGELGVASED